MSPKKTSRYLQAFVKLMLLSAIAHLIILGIYFIQTQDGAPLNFYSIVGATLFFPSLLEIPFATTVSIVTIFGLYITIFIFFTHEGRRTR